MDDAAATNRLKQVLLGTGCQVFGSRVVWAAHSSITDEHILRLAGWARLEFLKADHTALTDRSIAVLCDLPLTDLSICATSITPAAFLSAGWSKLQVIGIPDINFSGCSMEPLSKCRELTVVFANGCQLSVPAITELAQLPKMAVIEARSAAVGPVMAKDISNQFNGVTFLFDDGVWRSGEFIRAHS